MANIRKATVQFLLALFVANTAVCACAQGDAAVDTRAHHQPAEAGAHPDCHDDVCLGTCSQAVAAKSGLVTGATQIVRLELEGALPDTAELTVTRAIAIIRVSGPSTHRFQIPTDTPITRRDRLLA